jgi:subtilisin family serine protease
MKKLIAMLLCICMMLGLVACGAPAAKDAAATEAPETVQAEQPAAEAEKNDDAVAESEPTETEPAEETVEATEETTEPTTGKDSSDEKEEEATKPTEEEKPAEVLPNGDYNEGIVLVKVKETFDEADLGELEYTSAEPLFAGSAWYAVVLADSTKTIEAVSYLTALGTFAQVDYDYVMATDTSVEGVDVSANPQYSEQQHHYTHKVPEGWAYTAANNKYPGGSSDVIVAVIDTGVDYHHLDLRNNIWTNTAEIPNNGIDDDENGYIDDVYGWDFVGEDNSPLDDNGHGTHVAGIIAAENNSIGGVGIAYNCKIMALKAGNSSGYFNNSDIAEAVQYAYMNGASVINMSFGGSSISFVVREALETAYTSCVLVAAAGNDGMCNNVSCKDCDLKGVMYPAAMTCVIGVMSTGGDGSTISSFSNYDHYPHNAVEYEVYAVGESIPSCWPGNKYAKLNGTSMATPTVAAIAALLRSYLPDRNVYSTKFLQSQIVNTGTLYPYNAVIEKTDDGHSVVTIYEALTQLPKPDVKLYDYTIDDRISLNNKVNNGNGVIDAGETVRLSIALQNKGGVASNVQVTINAEHNGLADPYFTFVNDTMELSDIGTYSVRESGTEKYFEIQVSPDCPNDYLIDFNICYTYTNGMDETDETVYTDDGRQQAQFNVSRGWHLPAAIIQDTVFAADKLYILSQDMVIAEGVTVTFEAGTEIQFYDDREYFNSPAIKNYGTLNFNGTAGNMISIHPNERHSTFRCVIGNYGTLNMDYVSAVNLSALGVQETAKTYIQNSDLRSNVNVSEYNYTYGYYGGKVEPGNLNYHLLGYHNSVGTTEYTNNYIDLTCGFAKLAGTKFTNNYIELIANTISEVHIQNAESNTFFVNKTIQNSQENDFITFAGYTRNNAFYVLNDKLANAMVLDIQDKSQFTGNTFSKVYHDNAAQLIKGYYDNTGSITVDVFGELENTWDMWPNIEKVEILNSEGELTNTVGKEAIVIRITFNRPMDVGADTYLTFGTKAPYGDYRIDGSYVDELIWEGTYSLKAQIENGQNFLKVNNAYAMADSRVKVFGDHQLHEFTIDTSAALSMNLMAIPAETGIQLTWAQDDYTTLLGYNIYRSEAKDGNYVKLNPTILLPTDESFIDENAEPGKTYWYTYTVVLSDFSESNPAGKVAATALDTMAPSLYHTPVNQGYEYNNLVISCTASDNVGIRNVTLFYRTTGGEWKELPMLQTNDKFSATIFGSEVSLAGIEYYIVASDDVNTVTKGSAAEPYSVVIKSADALLGKGDVDGDGTVTTKDALMLMQCLNGDLLLSDDEFKRADLNVDGILSAVEALRILQYVNGKITSLV